MIERLDFGCLRTSRANSPYDYYPKLIPSTQQTAPYMCSGNIARLRVPALPLNGEELISAVRRSEMQHHFTLELLHALLKLLALRSKLGVLLTRCLDFCLQLRDQSSLTISEGSLSVGRGISTTFRPGTWIKLSLRRAILLLSPRGFA